MKERDLQAQTVTYLYPAAANPVRTRASATSSRIAALKLEWNAVHGLNPAGVERDVGCVMHKLLSVDFFECGTDSAAVEVVALEETEAGCNQVTYPSAVSSPACC